MTQPDRLTGKWLDGTPLEKLIYLKNEAIQYGAPGTLLRVIDDCIEIMAAQRNKDSVDA